MYEFGFWDFASAPIIIITAIAVIFPLQLLLCFKAKSMILRLCPVLLILLVLIALWISVFVVGAWLLLFISYLAVYYAALFLLASGAGWGIWAIIALWKHRS